MAPRGRLGRAITWLQHRPLRMYGLGAAGVLVVLALIPVALAQSSRRLPPAFQAATRGYLEGRYDEVASETAKLDQRDPAVAALRAQALIARGKYQEAEGLLRPVAAAAAQSEAALQLGLLLQMLSHPDAIPVLTKLTSGALESNDAQELGRAARALRALGRVKDANDTYRAAVSAAPSDPGLNTGWGELFLEGHNSREALKSFEDALQQDGKYTPALIGLARVLAEENPPQATERAKAVLTVNPSSVEVHVFLSGQAARAGRRDEARELLEKALNVNSSSLEAHSLLGALAYVEDKVPEFEAEVAKVLTLSPKYGEVYRVAGELAASNYRFDEAVDLTRKAAALTPGSPRVFADLGIHLLRTGDEPAAREALETSFKLDPYNVVTYNLLTMMDGLDKFTTVSDGDVILRMTKEDAPVLQEHALSLAHKALTDLSKRYDFTPKGPILIELFPKHDDFAVRNFGLPGMIGALGACFGRVVTLDSPRARPPGDFQWEATLWHELAHVITIQMSNQRIPRWLTEGISVYEQKVARQEWARGGDIEFANMLNQKKAIKLSDINQAFTDPELISIAYYETSLLVDHIVKTFGDAGLHRLVRAYGEGLENEAALKSALDTGFDGLQASFDAYLAKEFGALQEAFAGVDAGVLSQMPPEALKEYLTQKPGSFPGHYVMGISLRRAGDLKGAMAAFERAAELVPKMDGPDSPHLQMAQIAIDTKDYQRAITELIAALASDSENIDAARKAATLMKQEKVTDTSRLFPVYERLVALDPFDGDAHSMLGRLALERGDADLSIREFRTVLALKPIDQAAALTDLAEGYLKGGHRAEAKQQTLAALEIAPSYERAQDLLLKLAATP